MRFAARRRGAAYILVEIMIPRNEDTRWAGRLKLSPVCTTVTLGRR